nr:hypothetical protein BaRGS_030479 [Batillaria attramentaria]
MLLAGSPKLDRSKGRGQTKVDHLSKKLNGHSWHSSAGNLIDRGGAKNMTILMGDFNAKIGSDNTGYEDTMGTHGLGQMNENGERFADFCALNQLKLEVRKEKKTALNTSRTRRAKAKAQEEYTAADREVKRSTWKDKRDYIDNLASQAEEAARQGNLKDLYQQDLGEGRGASPVIKLPKKGDLRDCSNYPGIMLLSVPGKVLNRILLERMREAVDPMLRDQQAGFRRNRSCAGQIASLRIIVEQSLEWNSPLYINFIDYEKAFDSVDREALWKLLRYYGVPGKIISLIRCTYQDMSCRIAHAAWKVKVNCTILHDHTPSRKYVTIVS